MSFEEKVKEMAASGQISAEQAEAMRKSMGLLDIAPPPRRRKRVSAGAVAGIAALMLAASGVAAFWSAADGPEPSGPQNVAEAMNAAGAAGAASPALMMFFASLVFVVLPASLVMLWLSAVYNRLASAEAGTEEAAGIIAAARQKRADLLPQLGAAVKAALAHERKVQETAAAPQSGAQLAALMENYPALKADQNLLALQQQLIAVENGLETARNIYNYEAKRYNAALRGVAGGFAGALAGFREKEFFAAAAADEPPQALQEEEKHA